MLGALGVSRSSEVRAVDCQYTLLIATTYSGCDRMNSSAPIGMVPYS